MENLAGRTKRTWDLRMSAAVSVGLHLLLTFLIPPLFSGYRVPETHLRNVRVFTRPLPTEKNSLPQMVLPSRNQIKKAALEKSAPAMDWREPPFDKRSQTTDENVPIELPKPLPLGRETTGLLEESPIDSMAVATPLNAASQSGKREPPDLTGEPTLEAKTPFTSHSSLSSPDLKGTAGRASTDHGTGENDGSGEGGGRGGSSRDASGAERGGFHWRTSGEGPGGSGTLGRGAGESGPGGVGGSGKDRGGGEGISGKGSELLGRLFSPPRGAEGGVPRYSVNPRPAYPQEARKKGYEGEVLLKVEVLSSGRVGQIEIRQSSGHGILDEAALSAVKGWRFIPAKKGEDPISSWVNIPIKFKLQ